MLKMTFLSPLQISIHALREEGDSPAFCGEGSALVFLSTPSARRATSEIAKSNISVLFLSTPSARRATLLGRDRRVHDSISIHALREEGDALQAHVSKAQCNFYPRPPRGGRPGHADNYIRMFEFLSTPSARRATGGPDTTALTDEISIHALREEGDHSRPQHPAPWQQHFYPRPPRGGRRCGRWQRCLDYRFLSTPSARRATLSVGQRLTQTRISIHALREEGDVFKGIHPPLIPKISIHALREEGDCLRLCVSLASVNFYPRPPRGGRHGSERPYPEGWQFLSTPSARRATGQAANSTGILSEFLSTPSARRATQYPKLDDPELIFLSTPSARRATR